MLVVGRDFHTIRKQSGDIAPEVDTELHSAFFSHGGFAPVFGLIDQHPQVTLAMKPGGEAGFRQTMVFHWYRQCPSLRVRALLQPKQFSNLGFPLAEGLPPQVLYLAQLLDVVLQHVCRVPPIGKGIVNATMRKLKLDTAEAVTGLKFEPETFPRYANLKTATKADLEDLFGAWPPPVGTLPKVYRWTK